MGLSDGDTIQRVVMPKWGLSMTSGKITDWFVAEGDTVAKGDDLADVETDKIAGTLESQATGPIRAIVTPAGSDVPVSGTLALVAGDEVSDDEIVAAVEVARAELAELTQAAESDGDPGPPVETVVLGGSTIQYVTLGEGGSPVVLVHGFGGDKNSWLFVQEPLSASHQVYALDLPGHGTSTKDVGEGTLEELTGVVTGFLDALDLRDAHLVGHSLGGAVVMAAAAACDRVARLTLLAPAGFSGEADAEYLRGFAETNSRKELKNLVGRLFADEGQVTRRLVADLLAYKRLDGVHEALTTLLGTLLAADGSQAIDGPALLARSSVPVTVIWGARDAILPSTGAAAAQDAVGDRGSVTTLENAGHLVHMEAPQDTLRAMG